MKGDKFEIRLYGDRCEVHYGSQSLGAWMPKWSHLFPVPGGTFADAVTVVRGLVDEPGTGTVQRYAYMTADQARGVHRHDLVNAGGGDVACNSYRVQLRRKGWKPEKEGEV